MGAASSEPTATPQMDANERHGAFYEVFSRPGTARVAWIMKSIPHVGLATLCVLLALPATAQLDSSALRAKLGPPLHRETFRMPAGFDVIVDYGEGDQVCKIQVPALMPTVEKVARASEMKQRMYDFLADLVPASLRGKEIGRYVGTMGMISMSVIEYEHVTINELEYANQPFSKDNTINVSFKNEGCQEPPRN
jgi:hypothetical protein